jgi:hypothetical protein
VNVGGIGQQIRIGVDQSLDGIRVVVPDRVHELAALHQPRPARRVMTSREDELRVGELRVRGFDSLWMERGEIGDRLGGARAIRLQQSLRLVFELVEIGTDRMARRHDEPPDTPGVRCLGRRRLQPSPSSLRSRLWLGRR